jgi:hypothetical protein
MDSLKYKQEYYYTALILTKSALKSTQITQRFLFYQRRKPQFLPAKTLTLLPRKEAYLRRSEEKDVREFTCDVATETAVTLDTAATDQSPGAIAIAGAEERMPGDGDRDGGDGGPQQYNRRRWRADFFWPNWPF